MINIALNKNLSTWSVLLGDFNARVVKEPNSTTPQCFVTLCFVRNKRVPTSRHCKQLSNKFHNVIAFKGENILRETLLNKF
jgi:hypothetical protein